MNKFNSLNRKNIQFADHRGCLNVLFESDEIILKNSFSKKGVFRGMHWQLEPFAQKKIIRVVEGKIIDFIVDMNDVDHNLYYKKIGPEHGWILIEAQYAHGFYAVEDTSFEYLCMGEYNEKYEKSFSIIHVLNDHLGLKNLILSDKDKSAKALEINHSIEVEH